MDILFSYDVKIIVRPDFLSVDLREYVFRFRVGGGGGWGGEKKRKKKALKMTSWKKSSENNQLTGHFQRGFFPELFFFFNISRTNSKTCKVNQQSVLDL